jgi:L,D-transpeptidase YcbB
MQLSKDQYQYLTILIILLFIFSCKNAEKVKDKEIVTDPRTMDSKVAENIQTALQFALENESRIDDSTKIFLTQVVTDYYENTDHTPVWSNAGKWQSLSDTLYRFIANAELEGLFPEDYHFKNLRVLKNKLDTDSLSRMDAVLWTKADLLLTDGFMRIIKDLKLGRLFRDSITLNKDSVTDRDFFSTTLKKLLDEKQFTNLLISLQPTHTGYWELKKGIPAFVDSMDRRIYTHLKYPYKKGDAKDSVLFVRTLQKRLSEINYIDLNDKLPDSVQLSKAIKTYQQQKKLTADGKFGRVLVQSLNNNDVEKFKRIAITLDKYKQLPKKMPDRYIWVNIPGYYLWLIQDDTLLFESKVICGKPETRTPLLTAAITDMITYPTWTVPNSIIVKQYLPKLKNNPNYISKIGLHLVDNKGETIDPNTVNWSKYSRGIPYKVMQASGDNNSLGVIKFNFNNPYAVYLHDTNQRYLFKNASRALSHGCVRVQEWEKLAFYIAGIDSTASPKKDSLKYTSDSIRNWIARKERHRIDVKNHLPLFIRYFSCEGKNGQVKFYEDIYGEDKQLMEKYFAGK